MPRKSAPCLNCRSKRRPIKVRGFCSKCYYWQTKYDKCCAALDLIRSHPEPENFRKSGSLEFGRAEAKRALEELRWREEGMLADCVDAERLEALVQSLARDCRSTTAPDIAGLIEKMSEKTRRHVFEMLLVIVEQLPFRLPTLHTLIRPRKGAHSDGGWREWHRERTLSKEWSENVQYWRNLEREHFSKSRQ